jgi:hypothetical protein
VLIAQQIRSFAVTPTTQRSLFQTAAPASSQVTACTFNCTNPPVFYIVLPRLRHVSCHSSKFTILCWYPFMSFVISYRVTTFSTLRSTLNLWPTWFCFDAGNSSLGNEFPWYNHNLYRFLSCEISRHVHLFSDLLLYSIIAFVSAFLQVITLTTTSNSLFKTDVSGICSVPIIRVDLVSNSNSFAMTSSKEDKTGLLHVPSWPDCVTADSCRMHVLVSHGSFESQTGNTVRVPSKLLKSTE